MAQIKAKNDKSLGCGHITRLCLVWLGLHSKPLFFDCVRNRITNLQIKT